MSYFYEHDHTGDRVQKDSEDVLRVGGAKAVLVRLDGVIEVQYHGVFTRATLSALRKKIAHAVGGQSGLVFRYEKAMLFCGFSPGHEFFPQPSAEVVSLEQYELAVRFSGKCAEKGLMRAVLLPGQIVMARSWARRHALLAPA